MKKDKKLTVGLFMGGISSEKEISLESGRHVYNNLNRNKYEVIPVFMDDSGKFWQIEEYLVWMNTTSDIKNNLPSGGKRIFYEDLPKTIDFAFVCLHGKLSEDGTLRGLFEILDLPSNLPGVLGGALSMDKAFQRKLLTTAGINTPKHLTLSLDEWNELKMKKYIEKIKDNLGWPIIVKPTREGSSTALAKIEKEEDLPRALTNAFRWDNLVLLEEFLEGMEITTTIIGNDEPFALLPSQLLKKGAYLTAEEKFLPGGAQMITPPRLPREAIDKIQKDSVKTYKVLDLHIFSRIDAFWINGKVIIMEPNNPPAMTPSTALWQQVAEEGMNTSEFIDKIIELGMEANKNKIGPL